MSDSKRCDSVEKENMTERADATNVVAPTDMGGAGSGEKRAAGSPPDVAMADSSLNHNVKRIRTAENREGGKVFDGAYVYGVNAGDRILVKWDIVENENTDQERTIEHWWAGTLLEYDGKTCQLDDEIDGDTTNSVDKSHQGRIAVHTIEYDAYPEGGFPDKSREDVIFVSASEVVDVASQDVMSYKHEGDEGMVSLNVDSENINGFEDMVNTVLSNAMNKSFASNFDKLPAARQLQIAEKIATKKAKLVQLMDEFFRTSGKRVGTAKDMKELLEKTMQD